MNQMSPWWILTSECDLFCSPCSCVACHMSMWFCHHHGALFALLSWNQGTGVSVWIGICDFSSFPVANDLWLWQTVTDIVHYFKFQRLKCHPVPSDSPCIWTQSGPVVLSGPTLSLPCQHQRPVEAALWMRQSLHPESLCLQITFPRGAAAAGFLADDAIGVLNCFVSYTYLKQTTFTIETK